MYIHNTDVRLKSEGNTDRLTPDQRHANMAAIHSRDTRPELLVRHFLWHRGYRYRLNHRRLPGKPDIVLTKYRTCIFINGCFWHGHLTLLTPPVQSSACCKIPSTRQDFWVEKFRRNRERDERVQHELARMGWHCLTIWECQLKGAQREKTLESLDYTLNVIYLGDRSPVLQSPE